MSQGKPTDTVIEMSDDASSNRKKQVWLRPDQVELALLCFRFARSKLNEDTALGAHKHISGPFTYKRIAELIALFGGAP